MEKKSWNFDNSYAKLPQIFDSTQLLYEPLITFNDSLADLIGASAVGGLCGNEVQGRPAFGPGLYRAPVWSFTMLGDGRAILLGEQITVPKTVLIFS